MFSSKHRNKNKEMEQQKITYKYFLFQNNKPQIYCLLDVMKTNNNESSPLLLTDNDYWRIVKK